MKKTMYEIETVVYFNNNKSESSIWKQPKTFDRTKVVNVINETVHWDRGADMPQGHLRRNVKNIDYNLISTEAILDNDGDIIGYGDSDTELVAKLFIEAADTTVKKIFFLAENVCINRGLELESLTEEDVLLEGESYEEIKKAYDIRVALAGDTLTPKEADGVFHQELKHIYLYTALYDTCYLEYDNIEVLEEVYTID